MRGMVVDNSAAGDPALVGATRARAAHREIAFLATKLSGLSRAATCSWPATPLRTRPALLATGITVQDGATAQSNVVFGNNIGIDAHQR